MFLKYFFPDRHCFKCMFPNHILPLAALVISLLIQDKENVKNQSEEIESEKKSIEIKTVADVVRPNWLPGIEPDKKYILVGLHCCGDLSSVLSQLAVDKIEIVGIVLVPCCYHHLTETVDLSEAKIPNIKSQFVTGIGRGLEENKLVTTEVDNPEQTYIGPDTKLTRDRQRL